MDSEPKDKPPYTEHGVGHGCLLAGVAVIAFMLIRLVLWFW